MGVTPVDTEMEGDTAPLKYKLPVPEAAEPIPKWVIVLVRLVHAGNEAWAVNVALAPAMVQPPADLVMATRP